MKADRLREHYERIADAPDAIARLRRFVLDLAVRGKLVPQDAGDEPAVTVLRRRKIAIPIDAPFEIPSSWAWVNCWLSSRIPSGQDAR
jgi:type I restriction enzyme S subunit